MTEGSLTVAFEKMPVPETILFVTLLGVSDPSSADKAFEALKGKLIAEASRVIILFKGAEVNEEFAWRLEACCCWIAKNTGQELRLVGSEVQKAQLGEHFGIDLFASWEDAFWSFSCYTAEDRKRAEERIEGLRKLIAPIAMEVERETGKSFGQWFQEQRDELRAEEE